jgi:hypothetical protein
MTTDTKPVERTALLPSTDGDGKPAQNNVAPVSAEPERRQSVVRRVTASLWPPDRRSLGERLDLRHMFSLGSFLWEAVIFIAIVRWLFFS